MAGSIGAVPQPRLRHQSRRPVLQRRRGHGFLQNLAWRRPQLTRPGGWGPCSPVCVLDDLRETAKKHGLTFGPDPGDALHCTLGGMLGNDSCGSHSLLSAKHGYGLRTADNTHELEILTYCGSRMRSAKRRRRNWSRSSAAAVRAAKFMPD